MVGSLTSRPAGPREGIRCATENAVRWWSSASIPASPTGLRRRRAPWHRLMAADGGVIRPADGLARAPPGRPARAPGHPAGRASPRCRRPRSTVFRCKCSFSFRGRTGAGRRAPVPPGARRPVLDYTPQQVKSAVCGSGRAAKAQVAQMVASVLALGAPPSPTMPPTRSRSPCATPTARRWPRRCSHDRARRRRGGGPAPRPRRRGDRGGHRLPPGGVDRDPAPGPGGRHARVAAHPPGGARGRAGPLRLRDRGGARPLPAAHRRPHRRAEDGGRGAQRRAAARARRRAGRRRHRPPAGRARDRQAHGRAHRRRAAREGRRRARRSRRRDHRDARRRPAPPGARRPARAGLPPAEAQALVETATGETAEELLASALRGSRA